MSFNIDQSEAATIHQSEKVPMAMFRSPHRISAKGSLSFMRCVSLTLTGLISAWRQGEAPSAILAEPLSSCVTILCLRQCKSRHLQVCEILKKYVRCDVVSDASHTCCCCLFLLLTVLPPNRSTSLTTKIKVSVRQQIYFLDSSNNKFHVCGNLCTKVYFFCIVNRKNTVD